MKEIIVPLNRSPLSISIKDKHNRKIWGEEPAICTSESYLQEVITKSKHFYSYSPDHEFWPENPETQAGPIIYNRGTLKRGNSWMSGRLPLQDHMLIHSSFLFSKRPYLILLPGRKQTLTEESSKFLPKAQCDTFLSRSARL